MPGMHAHHIAVCMHARTAPRSSCVRLPVLLAQTRIHHCTALRRCTVLLHACMRVQARPIAAAAPLLPALPASSNVLFQCAPSVGRGQRALHRAHACMHMQVWGAAFRAVYDGPLKLQAEEVEWARFMPMQQVRPLPARPSALQVGLPSSATACMHHACRMMLVLRHPSARYMHVPCMRPIQSRRSGGAVMVRSGQPGRRSCIYVRIARPHWTDAQPCVAVVRGARGIIKLNLQPHLPPHRRSSRWWRLATWGANASRLCHDTCCSAF